MDEKLRRIMPKNKTGIYASEIRNMLIPNTTETYSMTKISLNNQPVDIGFRKHSAFKINVKPRQALVTVNTKLMEQQRPNTKVSYSHEFIIEDDSDKNSNTHQDDSENYVESSVANKYSFRPSAVLKKNKLYEDRMPLNSSRTSSSKSITLYNRNKNTNVYPDITNSITPILLNRREVKNTKSDSPRSTKNKNVFILNDDRNENSNDIKIKETSEPNLLSPKTRTEISSSNSNTQNIQYQPKTKSDLFKEIYEDLQNKSKNDRSKSNVRNKPYLPDNHEDLNEEKVDLIIKNLNEEEFVNLLKEYRKTRSFNLNTLLNKVEKAQNENLTNSALKSTTKIINLKAEFENSSNLTNFYTHSNTRFPSVSPSRNLNKSEIENKRIPEYFVNYLNNKILLKSSGKNVVGIVRNKNSDTMTSNAQLVKDIDEQTDYESKSYEVNHQLAIQHTTNSIPLEENSENKFQHLKILNIPTTAN
ncbi:unnamed protein product [Brachionus calyciflorus]|uniref:Uncharacterized protein n=1 Tax=Brachionus calyciflorus TaxID=104777 RepID=A0A813PRF5_9BILA|nr:unnamed protein product [Brachionus calyciflorus]